MRFHWKHNATKFRKSQLSLIKICNSRGLAKFLQAELLLTLIGKKSKQVEFNGVRNCDLDDENTFGSLYLKHSFMVQLRQRSKICKNS